jgi:pimeloyl-ACP methyl ester carboxylesterase
MPTEHSDRASTTERPTGFPDVATPNQIGRIKEVRVAREPLRLLWNLRSVANQPRRKDHPVLVVPGFGTNDASTFVVRAYLGRLGYRCSGWGLGLNTGDVEIQLEQTIEVLRRRHAEAGERVSLVAWSLGGVIARECARDAPEIVERVITFGTPLYGPRHTATSMARPSPRRDAIEAQIVERFDRPITRPVTAIYSRQDGVVAWEACIDPDPNTINVEVDSSHLGLGLDPDVLRLVATTLAAPAD